MYLLLFMCFAADRFVHVSKFEQAKQIIHPKKTGRFRSTCQESLVDVFNPKYESNLTTRDLRIMEEEGKKLDVGIKNSEDDACSDCGN